MLKPRLVLFMLLVIGVLLEIATIYAAYHPLSPIGKPAIALHIMFLLVVPVVVWKMHGERLIHCLRTQIDTTAFSCLDKDSPTLSTWESYPVAFWKLSDLSRWVALNRDGHG
jgi:hypothetical protein